MKRNFLSFFLSFSFLLSPFCFLLSALYVLTSFSFFLSTRYLTRSWNDDERKEKKKKRESQLKVKIHRIRNQSERQKPPRAAKNCRLRLRRLEASQEDRRQASTASGPLLMVLATLFCSKRRPFSQAPRSLAAAAAGFQSFRLSLHATPRLPPTGTMTTRNFASKAVDAVVPRGGVESGFESDFQMETKKSESKSAASKTITSTSTSALRRHQQVQALAAFAPGGAARSFSQQALAEAAVAFPQDWAPVDLPQRQQQQVEKVPEGLERLGRMMEPEFDVSEEYEKLVETVGRLEMPILQKLVAHRGFHAVGDRLERPIENTVKAYREAARAGVHMSECDITVTSDGHLILCHDSTIERLARDVGDATVKSLVTELTLEQARAIALLDGSSIALFEDVVEQARALKSKLVVEVKSGASNVSDALARLFLERPWYLEAISVVMSFDFSIMAAFSQKMTHVSAELAMEKEALPKMLLLLRNPREHGEEDDDVELELDFADSEKARVAMRGYLEAAHTLGGPLDGLYIQLHDSMLFEDNVRSVLREFCMSHTLGVWTSSTQQDLDCVDTCYRMMDLNISFMNTDFPPHFHPNATLI